MFINELKGFSLIEIIVVLIILGVLSSLALPNLFTYIEISRENEALPTIKSLLQKIEAYITLHPDTSTTEPVPNFELKIFSSNELSTGHFTYVIGVEPVCSGHAVPPCTSANPQISSNIIVSALRNKCDGDWLFDGDQKPNFIWYGVQMDPNNSTINQMTYCGDGIYKNLSGGSVSSCTWTSWYNVYGGNNYLSAIAANVGYTPPEWC